MRSGTREANDRGGDGLGAPRTALLSAVLGLLLALAPVGVVAQAASPLLTATDPLDRARIVARVGDRALLAWLAPSASASEQLAAVRSAPWLADPAAALQPLCALLAGRDPDIAPAAALSIAQIAQRLAGETNLREDLSQAQLKTVIEGLQATSQQARVRVDLRLLATQSAAQLEILLLRLQG